MPDLSPEAVQRLRSRSGCGMDECAWALRVTFTEEQAAEALRLRGIALYTKPGYPTRLERFLRDIQPPRLAQPEAEQEGLRVDLSMWSDETKRAIYYALHRDPACVPRSTAHGSGANPIAPPPDWRAG